MTPAYLAEIERAFTAKAGRGLMLSPADRERVAAWARAGVPAAVVVEGIERAFDKPPARRVRGLAYAASAIDRQIKLWRDARAGRTKQRSVDPTEVVEASFRALLEHIVTRGRAEPDPRLKDLKRAAWQAVEGVYRQWQRGVEADPVRALLLAEGELLDEAQRSLDASERERLEGEVSDLLEMLSIHDPETRRITRQVLLHNALRELLDLPPLELKFGG